ncbi:MAG: hypothetical protein KH031_24155 [Clostridiales bacterium]|nr:hypothetical protein [Clostridiales bacterium]
MAMIDYGALLRINGKFINKNIGLFMNQSNTGYILEKARYKNSSVNDKYININGNFYVYAGDKNLLLTFHKGSFYVISNGIILKSISFVPFIAETFYINDISIKVAHLEPDIQANSDKIETWKEFVRNNWINATGEEKIYDLEHGFQEYKRFIKRVKRARRNSIYKYRTNRWNVEWKYNGDKYEVIFGYGIDPNIETWNEIKNNSYGFTEKEINIIDKWFNG